MASFMLAVTMACLALNHVLGRAVHDIAPPVGLSFWRWCIAAALVLVVIRRRLAERLPVYRRHWRLFLVLGAMMVGSTTLFVVTLQVTTAINVSLVNALQPAMTAGLSWLILRHRLTPLQAAGIVLTIIGVATMVSRGSLQQIVALEFNRGDLFALIGVLGLSGYAIVLRRLPAGLAPLEALFGILVAGCMVVLPVYIAETIFFKPFVLSPAIGAAMAAMAVFGSLLGNLMWNIGNQALGPNKASIFINLIPVFGTLMAVAFLGERLRAYHLAGFALICAGVWCVLARQLVTAQQY